MVSLYTAPGTGVLSFRSNPEGATITLTELITLAHLLRLTMYQQVNNQFVVKMQRLQGF